LLLARIVTVCAPTAAWHLSPQHGGSRLRFTFRVPYVAVAALPAALPSSTNAPIATFRFIFFHTEPHCWKTPYQKTLKITK
jgi:hypothetical protein